MSESHKTKRDTLVKILRRNKDALLVSVGLLVSLSTIGVMAAYDAHTYKVYERADNVHTETAKIESKYHRQSNFAIMGAPEAPVIEYNNEEYNVVIKFSEGKSIIDDEYLFNKTSEGQEVNLDYANVYWIREIRKTGRVEAKNLEFTKILRIYNANEEFFRKDP